MTGPPALKLRIKKFLSNSVSGAAAVDGLALPVVVAGVITAVAGVIPATGDIAGAAGLAIVAGTVAIVAGDVAGADGGVWLKEISTSVKKQKLAISNVFIG
jgi:hypothetical protein